MSQSRNAEATTAKQNGRQIDLPNQAEEAALASDTEFRVSQPTLSVLPAANDPRNRGTLQSRQNTVLRMQQQFGNRAVQRMLNARAGNVQRDDDPVDAGTSTSSSQDQSSAPPVSSNSDQSSMPTSSNDPDQSSAPPVSSTPPSSSNPDQGSTPASSVDQNPDPDQVQSGMANVSAAVSTAGGTGNAGSFQGSRADKLFWDGVNLVPGGAVINAGVDTAAGVYDYATDDSEAGSKRMDGAVNDLKALNPLVATANLVDDSKGDMNDRVDPGQISDAGNRINNATWDVVGVVPEIGNVASGISAVLDGGSAAVREGQSLYNTVTGDEKTAKLRDDQAGANGASALLDLTGMIPIWGNIQSGLQVADDLAGSSGGSSQDVWNAVKTMGPSSTKTATLYNDTHTQLPGIPEDAKYIAADQGDGPVLIEINGKQQVYKWDAKQQIYVPAN